MGSMNKLGPRFDCASADHKAGVRSAPLNPGICNPSGRCRQNLADSHPRAKSDLQLSTLIPSNLKMLSCLPPKTVSHPPAGADDFGMFQPWLESHAIEKKAADNQSVEG